MALWAGTSLDTNIEAKLFNRIARKKSIPMVVDANSLLYSMLGKPNSKEMMEMAAGNKQLSGWMKSSKITGDKYEFSLLGALPSPGYISDGADELTAVTPDYNSARHGAVTFDLAHLGLPVGIPSSEYDRISGNEAKTTSWVDEKFNETMWGYEELLGAALSANSTTAYPARNKFASWLTAVDNANTGYGLDRSDAANADFQATVASSVGSLDLDKIQLYINTAKTKLGRLKIGVAGITLFTKIQQIAQAYTQTTYNRNEAEVGADHCYIAGVDFLLEQRTPDGVVGMFDPKWWEIVFRDTPFTRSGLKHEPTYKDGYLMNTTLWCQNLCQYPRGQVKLVGAS